MSVAGPPRDMIGLELELIRFYHSIVAEEIRWGAGVNMQFLQQVKNAYCKWTLQNRLSNIYFHNPGMRCAYIFLNTPCFSSTVAFHFLGLLRFNPKFLQKILSQGTLSVCCLGGGPASELVAILKVFEFLLRLFRPRTLMVQATIVDIDPGWQTTTRWIKQNWWKHFDTSLIKLSVTFVRADLTDSLGTEVREAVGSADILTMVKFLSAVFGTTKRDKIPLMLQEVTDCLPVGAVLFFMNCSRFSCDQALHDVIATGGHMKPIYTPAPNHVYRLSPPALEECFRFYFRYYGWQSPTPENKSDVIAWWKREQRKTSS